MDGIINFVCHAKYFAGRGNISCLVFSKAVELSPNDPLTAADSFDGNSVRLKCHGEYHG